APASGPDAPVDDDPAVWRFPPLPPLPLAPPIASPPPAAPPGIGADLPAPAAPEPAPAVVQAEPDPCGDGLSRAQDMVCHDARLAVADARLREAYERALAAGAPREGLAREQDDWMAIREDAARYSRRAL